MQTLQSKLPASNGTRDGQTHAPTAMTNHRVPCLEAYPRFGTAALREGYRLDDLFQPDAIRLVYTDLDRVIVGAAVPVAKTLVLEAGEQLRSEYFCERRELGIINLGGDGVVVVDGTAYEVGRRECLYIGRGTREISFASQKVAAPAQFYFLSYPAHAVYATVHARVSDARKLLLGSREDANERHLYQYIHPGGIRSCQLVMGFTELQSGSIWNTMAPHTHDRRSEVYCYFDISPGHRVAHFMGEPSETRVIWAGEKDVLLSPSWSVHCGAGTNSYAFVWGMGGENQRFDDMDGFPVSELR